MGGMQPMSDAPPLPSQSPRFLTQSGPVRRDTGDMQRAFGLGFLVAAVLAVISSFVLTGSVSGLFRSKGEIAAKSSVAAMKASSTALGEILAVPPTSARGVDARSVDLGEALKRADLSLHSDNGGDKEEAQYWLRRALALGLGDQRLVWAMTQLGTMYASPATGAPDYGAARSLWELAAAQSDPVAMCFLASLHEHGLGGARDPAQALYLYRRAKAKGGCRNVDQSIARLAKAAP